MNIFIDLIRYLMFFSNFIATFATQTYFVKN